MKYRYSIYISLFCMLGFLGACSNEQDSTSTNEEANETVETEQLDYIIPEDFSVRSIEMITKEHEINLSYQNEEWETEGLEQPDPTAISDFVNELFNIKGIKIEKGNIEGDPIYLSLSNKQNKYDVEIWSRDGEYFASVNDQAYKVSELPITLKPFDKSFLEQPIQTELDEITEIQFFQNDKTVVLNKQTTMNEVEKIPFISGWYLHETYDTSFSIEYRWMEKVLESFRELHGYETTQTLDEVIQTITLKNQDTQEILSIGPSDDNQYTLVAFPDRQTQYLVPNQLMELYQFEPLEVVDNFIALIPLDAVQTVSIKSEDKEYYIKAEHNLDLNQEEKTELESTFYLNNKEIDNDVFRRNYQYLARLSYSEELTPEEIEQVDLSESTVTIDYSYLNKGETINKRIALIPEEDGTQYIVANDGIIEFKMTDEKLKELFEAFEALI